MKLIRFLCFLFIVLVEFFPLKAAERFEINFFDVGQGNCTLVKCPGGAPLLVDAGSSCLQRLDKPRKFPNFIKNRITSKIRQYSLINKQNINVLISHPDIDHYKWIPEILSDDTLAAYNKRIVLGGNQEGSGAYQISFRNFLDTLPQGFTQYAHTYENSNRLKGFFDLGEVECYILKVVQTSKNTNDLSVILKLTYQNHIFILTGDATGKTTDGIRNQILINQQSTFLKATVLQASHHGAESHNSNHEDWINLIQANYIVISSGAHGQYNHPRSSVINRLILRSNLRDRLTHPVQYTGTPFEPITDYNIIRNKYADTYGYNEEGPPNHNYQFLETSKTVYSTLDQGDIKFTLQQTAEELRVLFFPRRIVTL